MARRQVPGMGGMGNMNMVKQAQKLQQDMMKAQEELMAREYSASSGGGAVTVVALGSRELVSVTIKPEAVDPEDVEMLQDMVLTAANEALRKAEDDMQKEMSRYTGGLGLF